MTTAITHNTAPYVDDSYVDPGYIESGAGVGVQFIHDTAGTLTFSRSPKYPAWTVQTIQAIEQGATGRPMAFNPILTQVPFNLTWPALSDAELAALRAFIFEDCPLFSTFQLYLKKWDEFYMVRLAAPLSLAVRHVKKGYSEATVNLVRV